MATAATTAGGDAGGANEVAVAMLQQALSQERSAASQLLQNFEAVGAQQGAFQARLG